MRITVDTTLSHTHTNTEHKSHTICDAYVLTQLTHNTYASQLTEQGGATFLAGRRDEIALLAAQIAAL